MPDFDAHVQAAKKHFDCLSLLKPQVQQHPEWVVISAFYTAVHLVESVFACENTPHHSDSHHDRNDRLKTILEYEQLNIHYHPLYVASIISRYMEYAPMRTKRIFHPSIAGHIQTHSIVAIYVNRNLFHIHRIVRQLTGKTLPFSV